CLRSSARTEEEIVEALRPFWGPGAIPVDEVLGELVRRGWVAGDGAGRHALTPGGAAGHTASQERVHAIRAARASGLPEEAYQRTIPPLRRRAETLASGASRRAVRAGTEPGRRRPGGPFPPHEPAPAPAHPGPAREPHGKTN